MRHLTTLSLFAAASLLAACSPNGTEGPGEDFGSSEDGVKVCAAGETVRGVDVSYYQGNIDWNAAHGDGIAFAVARVSDGTGFKDPKFAKNWTGMRDAGVIRGAYQFFRPKQDPIAQADLAIAMINDAGGMGDGDLPLMLDLEVNDGVSAGTLLARAKAWLDHVEQATGRTPMIYTGAYFWQQFGGPGGYDKYPLVTANWETKCPAVPDSWSNWTFWQDADNGHVAGIPALVDTDVFNGSLADLQAFVKGAGAPPGGGDPGKGDPGGILPYGECGVLAPGKALGVNESVTSCDGRFTLIQQDDGNLVLYMNGVGALWATGTDKTAATVTVMQEDGNLVVYTGEGKPLWDSHTWGNDGAWLAVQDDGNLVIYSSKAIWASGTDGY